LAGYRICCVIGLFTYIGIVNRPLPCISGTLPTITEDGEITGVNAPKGQGTVITRKAKQSLPLKKNRLLSFAHMEKIIEKSAIPAEAGIREDLRFTLDSRLHGNDLEARVGHA
jgi:hypothetical protein